MSTETKHVKPLYVDVQQFISSDTPLNMQKQYFAIIPFIMDGPSNDIFFLNGKSACKIGDIDCPIDGYGYTVFQGILDNTTLTVQGNVGKFVLLDDNQNIVLCFKAAVEK